MNINIAYSVKFVFKRVIEKFIQEDQYELMKETQKVKEAMNEGK
jgi:hypothetical protein